MEVFNRPKNKLSKTTKSIINSIFFSKRKIKDNSQLFKRATIAFLNNDVYNALIGINNCIEFRSKKKWEYFVFKACCLEYLQEFNKAIECYEIAIELIGPNKNMYALYHQIGYCYFNLNKDHKAIEFYTNALQFKRGIHTKKKEDFQDAIGDVLLSVSLQRIYYNRANSLKNRGNLNDAIKDCKKAISIDEHNSNPYLLLSTIYTLKRDKEKALEFLKIAVRQGNSLAQIKMNEIDGIKTTIQSQ